MGPGRKIVVAIVLKEHRWKSSAFDAHPRRGKTFQKMLPAYEGNTGRAYRAYHASAA